jgi:hypothetical protein
LVFRSGRGDLATYRAASATELDAIDGEQKHEGLSHLVVAVVSRFGPLTREGIAEHVRFPAEKLDRLLKELAADGRLKRDGGGTAVTYAADACVIPFGEPAGWEAAIFDHYQAMVTAICVKLRGGELSANLSDAVGGSTYTLDLWEGHPLESEALGLLAALRKQGRELRERVEAYNRDHEAERARGRELRVITYVGQGVLASEKEEGDGEW